MKSIVLLSYLLLTTGCSVFSRFPSQQVTSVDLGHKDFQIVQKSIVGTDQGFALLGFIPVTTPSMVDAMTSLMSKVDSDGRSVAIVNVAEAIEADYWVLFSITRVKIRADVVEFTAD
jgi:hypothetical protein